MRALRYVTQAAQQYTANLLRVQSALAVNQLVHKRLQSIFISLVRGATRPKSPCGDFPPPLPSGNFFFLAKRNCRKKRASAAQHNVTSSVARTKMPFARQMALTCARGTFASKPRVRKKRHYIAQGITVSKRSCD